MVFLKNMKISSSAPDWSREKKTSFTWQPSRSLLCSIRQYQKYAASTNCLVRFLSKIEVIKHRFWSVITGADIPLSSNIRGGLLLPHPNGVVIHPDAVIGPNCLIFQQVTIGSRGEGGSPVIGGHVDIGAGARILGNIHIGNHAVIGANAVVIRDVPDYHSAIGVPAVIRRRCNRAMGEAH